MSLVPELRKELGNSTMQRKLVWKLEGEASIRWCLLQCRLKSVSQLFTISCLNLIKVSSICNLVVSCHFVGQAKHDSNSEYIDISLWPGGTLQLCVLQLFYPNWN